MNSAREAEPARKCASSAAAALMTAEAGVLKGKRGENRIKRQNMAERTENMMYSGKIRYKGRRIPEGCSDRERAAEMLLDQIITEAEIACPEEKVEQELRTEWAGFCQTMRYRAMGGDHQMEEIDPDEWRESIRKEIIRDYQTESVLKFVIEEENLSVSCEELEAAARELAEKEHTTLEMVRRFMGEDYSLMKKEVLYKKAKNFLVDISATE